MANLHTDRPAPDFRLPASAGHVIHLADYRQYRPVVLLFLPDLASAPARALLSDYAAHYDAFREEGAEVLAITPQPDGASGLPFPALTDADGAVRARYLDDPAQSAVFILDRYTAPYRWEASDWVEGLMSASDALEWVRLSEYRCTMCDDASIEWDLASKLAEIDR